MADENGVNKIAIGKVFGEDLQKKTISCQWHYLRCALKQSQRITDTNMKERFLELTKSMVKDAVTKICTYSSIENFTPSASNSKPLNG